MKAHVPDPQLVYGRLIYWLTVAACAICTVGPALSMLWPGRNVLSPHVVFARVFAGHTPSEVWAASGEGFPGSHFYRRHPFRGDSLTQFGLAVIGCSSAAWALFAAAWAYLRARDRLFAGFSIALGILILLAMCGLAASCQ